MVLRAPGDSQAVPGCVWGHMIAFRRLARLNLTRATGSERRRGAIKIGLTVEDIKEVLLRATVYCGIPAGLDTFTAANEVLKDMGKVK
jgi:hypothetical protein